MEVVVVLWEVVVVEFRVWSEVRGSVVGWIVP